MFRAEHLDGSTDRLVLACIVFLPGGVTAVWPGQQVKFSINVMNPSYKDTCWLRVIRGSGSSILEISQQPPFIHTHTIYKKNVAGIYHKNKLH